MHTTTERQLDTIIPELRRDLETVAAHILAGHPETIHLDPPVVASLARQIAGRARGQIAVRLRELDILD